MSKRRRPRHNTNKLSKIEWEILKVFLNSACNGMYVDADSKAIVVPIMELDPVSFIILKEAICKFNNKKPL